MAECLRRAQPHSVANHVKACQSLIKRSVTWLATESGWAWSKHYAICSGKLCRDFIIFEQCCPCASTPSELSLIKAVRTQLCRKWVSVHRGCNVWALPTELYPNARNQHVVTISQVKTCPTRFLRCQWLACKLMKNTLNKFTLWINHVNQCRYEMKQTWGCLLKSKVSPCLNNNMWSIQ